MKNYIGLDIGTTSVSAVRVAGGKVEQSVTLSGSPFLCDYARTQDADVAVQLALSAFSQLKNEETAAVGVTGQMHGILYVDKEGNAISPLYTWQNPYGNELFAEGESYASRISALTGYKMASGYGLTTLFYHTVKGEVPQGAAKICTVHDYLAMKLAENCEPVTHPSDAASLGAFDLASLCFDRPALNKAGVNCDLLPTVQKDGFVGKTAEGIPVTVAIGDNQAAVYGALGNQAGVSVNVGTGSQVSVPLAALPEQAECEIRPYLFGAYLGVDCPLCGGRSYALLRDFFAQTLAAFGAETSGDLYTPLNALLEKGEEKYLSSAPCFTPLFCGTRTSPKSRATIEGISDKNFTPEAFAFALVEGMAQELWEGYEKIAGGLPVAHLAASGNGIRKNPVLARALQRKFGAPLTLPEGKEEAAFGAAKYAFDLKENAYALCEKNPIAANAL